MRSHLFLVSVLVLFLGGKSVSAAPVVIDRLEASVNSSLILLSDISKFRHLYKLRAQLDPLFNQSAIAQKGPDAPVKDIVEFLIDEKLIVQAFPVSDAEVEQEINTIQSNNHITREQLKTALTDQGYTFDEYFELIRASASKRNLIDRDIRTKVTISDDDVKNYFYNHYSKSAAIPFAYHIEIISVSVKNYKSATAARDVIARAQEEIKGGESFEEVAKRISDDSSAQSGGDLGTVTDDQLSPIIRDQTKRLQIGELSAVFGGPQAGAFYLIKLIDVKSSDSDRFDKMKEEIRNQLATTEYQHQISLWLERQRQTAFVHRAGEPSIAALPVH